MIPGEIHHQLANSGADYLVTLPLLLGKVQEAIGNLDIQVFFCILTLIIFAIFAYSSSAIMITGGAGWGGGFL